MGSVGLEHSEAVAEAGAADILENADDVMQSIREALADGWRAWQKFVENEADELSNRAFADRGRAGYDRRTGWYEGIQIVQDTLTDRRRAG